MKKSSKNNIRHIDVINIKDPSFLNDLSHEELLVLCDDLRKYLLQTTSKTGGHLSSNLGVVELTTSLCKEFDFTKDKIIFDVGHQSYIYKILTGRDLTKLRQKGGISGFQKREESPFDHYEAGHSSTSISAASGLAIARDLDKKNYHVIAFIGDASLVNGLSLEGLNNAALDNHKIIIVLNINDMSISEASGSMANVFRKLSTTRFYSRGKHAYRRLLSHSKLGRAIFNFSVRGKNWIKRHLIKMTVFDTLGYHVIGPVDGHNLKELEKAFKSAKRSDKSAVVMVKTTKGKGYEPAEKDKLGKWHGVGKFDIEKGEIYKDANKISWSELYEKSLYEIMKNNPKAVTIVPATGLGSCLTPIKNDFSKRFFDVGIAEEHALVLGAGLGVSGYHPFISMYSTFLQRGYDEISHDLARMNVNSTLLIDRAGLVGEDGETHQGIYDEQFLYGIPNTVITMASDETQIDSLMKESLNNHGVFAIRYPRGSVSKREFDNVDIPFGCWRKELVSLNNKTAVVSYGYLINSLKEEIKDKDVTLINAIYQKPLNEKICDELLNYQKIIIYTPYSIKYGFASYLTAHLVNKGYKGDIIIKALEDKFVKQASINEQLEEQGLLVKNIAQLI